MPKASCAFLILFAALAVSPAAAANMVVMNAWFRALPANLPGAGYFVLKNQGPAAATLTGASSPACGMLMLHESESMNGMSSMSEVQSVPVPAHGKATFAPGGYHLMCMQSSLKPGTNVPVTLQFADGTRLDVNFAVKGANGK